MKSAVVASEVCLISMEIVIRTDRLGRQPLLRPGRAGCRPGIYV